MDTLNMDAVFIGSGQAAPPLAVALAGRGDSVALIESHLLGGTCVNVGCTPTKTLRKSARVAWMAQHAAEFGVHVGTVRIDFAQAMERMQQRVDTARASLAQWLDGTPGLRVLRAAGALAGREGERFVVTAGEQRLLARRVYLNTGTRPFMPPIDGIDTVPTLDNTSLLQLRERPAHLLILGGSYIGLEMAQIFRRLGSEVSVIETGPRIAAREDADISRRIAALLRDEGIRIFEGQSVLGVRQASEGQPGVVLTLAASEAGAARSVQGSHLLVATGRLPNTERLGLASVGVATDARGFVPTNGRLETNVPGIWALGDINKRGAFTHTSFQDHEITLANHDGRARSADDRVPTYAMFTDPPLGRVGLNETDARALVAKGRRILIASHEMKDVSRAKEESETVGVIQLLVDADSERFLGATFFGLNGDEIVQVIGNAMAAGASYRLLKDALPVHPTVTEFLPTILGKLSPLQ